ncbi:MAG: hypothetical protein ACP5VR_01240 [Acidimicrobiales bacterium]
MGPLTNQHRKLLLAALPAVAIVAGSGAGAHGPGPTTSHVTSTAVVAGTTSCNYSSRFSYVQGTPDVAKLPSLESISVLPEDGGLMVTYKFRKPLVLAPEGVYFSWTVTVYRHRSDAASYNAGVKLEVQYRGPGWEPTGWTATVSGPGVQSPVEGGIQSDKLLDRLQEFFPSGLVDLKPPFYWYATEEIYRAYMPQKSSSDPQNFNVNGTIVTDCPGGIRPNPYRRPDASRLISAV